MEVGTWAIVFGSLVYTVSRESNWYGEWIVDLPDWLSTGRWQYGVCASVSLLHGANVLLRTIARRNLLDEELKSALREFDRVREGWEAGPAVHSDLVTVQDCYDAAEPLVLHGWLGLIATVAFSLAITVGYIWLFFVR